MHATFGLINSTPHSAFLPAEEMRGLLTSMAAQGTGATGPGVSHPL